MGPRQTKSTLVHHRFSLLSGPAPAGCLLLPGPLSTTTTTTTTTKNTMAADTPRCLPDGRLSIHALCLPENVPPEPHAQAPYFDHDSNTPLSAYSSNTTAYTSSADDDETMSFTSGLSIDDPDVRLAAEALEDLRCEYATDKQSTPERTPQQSSVSEQRPQPQSELFNRMSNYTLVSSAVKVYESGKSYSRGFKYGAEMVESVARPVVRRFEPLEGFALRQLDRLERRSISSDIEKQQAPLSPRTQVDVAVTQSPSSSRWHAVITNASGLTVAMSDESLKSLRYCLQWLKYANSHLTKAVETLQVLLEEQQQRSQQTLPLTQATDASSDPSMSQQQQQTRSQLLAKVAATKADIVATIKKVVGVVSTYAGAALPEPARSHVRGYLLILPSRWAQASSALQDRRRNATDRHDESSEREHANRVIVLASEALQMLGGVMHVVGDTLDRAEGWCDRMGRRQTSSSEPMEDVKMEDESAGEGPSSKTPAATAPPQPEGIVDEQHRGFDQDQDVVMSG
ncbi:transcription factor Opi1-domain-containing protein [Lipomyces kononenkoae]|uniref:Transcription factor Opi1-domain-containing protein n=1 Tax=Lipomyces kononenkoae TaxID=34357 RepID=A0ACC3T3G0_LIPKO